MLALASLLSIPAFVVCQEELILVLSDATKYELRFDIGYESCTADEITVQPFHEKVIRAGTKGYCNVNSFKIEALGEAASHLPKKGHRFPKDRGVYKVEVKVGSHNKLTAQNTKITDAAEIKEIKRRVGKEIALEQKVPMYETQPMYEEESVEVAPVYRRR